MKKVEIRCEAARGGVVYAKATMDIRNNRDAESPL